MKRLIVAAMAASLAVLVALPVYAIRYGEPDAGEHPYVGLMVATTEDGTPLWRCSGTLISPTVFLTAGHCTEAPAARANIWFEEDARDREAIGYPFGGGTNVTGTTHTHPQYDPNAFYLYDLGVVVLDEPVLMDTYGALPALGAVDALYEGPERKRIVEAVGYGLQSVVPVTSADLLRLKADLSIVNLEGTGGIPEGTSMFVSGDAAKGGTCFGDSGGPQFQKDTNTVLAVTSYGLNANCVGVGGGYRIDQPDDLEWLAGYLDDDQPQTQRGRKR